MRTVETITSAGDSDAINLKTGKGLISVSSAAWDAGVTATFFHFDAEDRKIPINNGSGQVVLSANGSAPIEAHAEIDVVIVFAGALTSGYDISVSDF